MPRSLVRSSVLCLLCDKNYEYQAISGKINLKLKCFKFFFSENFKSKLKALQLSWKLETQNQSVSIFSDNLKAYQLSLLKTPNKIEAFHQLSYLKDLKLINQRVSTLSENSKLKIKAFKLIWKKKNWNFKSKRFNFLIRILNIWTLKILITDILKKLIKAFPLSFKQELWATSIYTIEVIPDYRRVPIWKPETRNFE